MPRERRLQRRGTRWYVRVVVPPGIRDQIGKTEFVVALGTSDFREATSLAKLKSVEIDAQFAAAWAKARRAAAVSAGGKIHPAAEPLPDLSILPEVTMPEPVLASWVRSWLHDVERANLSRFVMVGPSEDEAVAAEEEAAWLHDPSEAGEAERVANAILAQRGHRLEPESRRVLVHLLHRALLEEAQRRHARFAGRVDVGAFDHEFADVQATKPPPAGSTLTLGLLLERYEADPARRGLSEKTRTGYRIIADALVELLGRDKPLDTITRDDCRRVQQVLATLPPNARKRFPKLSLEEAAAKAVAEGLAPISPGTANSYLNNLAALFNWAVKEDYLEKNPAKGLRVAPNGSKKGKRKPYSVEQLKAIFHAPLFTGCQDDQHGYAVPGPNRPRRGRFWVPLLSLYTGMRLGEVCQLHVADVRELDGVPCLIISEDAEPGGDAADAKRVKTDAGERFVPVHPELKRIGFMQYVAEMRKKGEARLFPELKPGAMGYLSDNFQKWWGRFTEQAGAAAPRTSFHSFRHSFRDALREGGVHLDAVRALGGWAGGGGASEIYGAGLRPSSLAREIAKVRYRGLDLSHLYQQPRSRLTTKR